MITVNVILSQFFKNSEYVSKILPYIKSDYFDSISQKDFVKLAVNYVNTYQSLPQKEVIIIQYQKLKNRTQPQFEEFVTLCNEINDISNTFNFEWLMKETEDFFKQRAIYNAISESIQIYEGNSKLEVGYIPELMQKALSVGFNNEIGHDFFKNNETRFDLFVFVGN